MAAASQGRSPLMLPGAGAAWRSLGEGFRSPVVARAWCQAARRAALGQSLQRASRPLRGAEKANDANRSAILDRYNSPFACKSQEKVDYFSRFPAVLSPPASRCPWVTMWALNPQRI